MTFRALDKQDPDIAQLIRNEFKRQSETLELIPSENLASPAILEALGTLLTNKYSEGYPGRRYYGGCEVMDEIETLAQERARQLFGAQYVNVQPHAGSQANAAVYQAVCQPGDRVMGMDLSAGGHLTHGSPANFSGKLYEIHSYGVDRETERIDYDSVQKLAEEVRPKMLLAGFSAYSRIVDWQRMRYIADPSRGDHVDHHTEDSSRRMGRDHPLPQRLAEGHRLSSLSRHAGRSAHACHRRQGRVL